MISFASSFSRRLMGLSGESCVYGGSEDEGRVGGGGGGGLGGGGRRGCGVEGWRDGGIEGEKYLFRQQASESWWLE